MKIGVIIGHIGGTDGVSLETQKWIDTLDRMGHKIYLISGLYKTYNGRYKNKTLIPEISSFSPQSYWEQNKTFYFPNDDKEALINHYEKNSDLIANHLVKWIKTHKIKLLISENASSFPLYPSRGMGIKKAIEKTGIPCISHNHDFPWSFGNKFKSVHPEVNELIDEYYPLRLPSVHHVVINTINQKRLMDRLNISSHLIPNVIDFETNFGTIQTDNKSLIKDLGMSSKDILLFQNTRIVRRKGIHTALELIHKLDDKRIKLIITGTNADDEGNEYSNELLDLMHEYMISDRVVFASHFFNNRGLFGNEADKRYSLSDAYAHANACTFFSTYEGFGNGFLEAILAKKPVFVNNYRVFREDIAPKGFKTVCLEDGKLTARAVADMDTIIRKPKIAKEMAEHNYETGKKFFSFQILENKLDQILSEIF